MSIHLRDLFDKMTYHHHIIIEAFQVVIYTASQDSMLWAGTPFASFTWQTTVTGSLFDQKFEVCSLQRDNVCKTATRTSCSGLQSLNAQRRVWICYQSRNSRLTEIFKLYERSQSSPTTCHPLLVASARVCWSLSASLISMCSKAPELALLTVADSGALFLLQLIIPAAPMK